MAYFYHICKNSNKWKKWVSKDFNHNDVLNIIRICGHYNFSNFDLPKVDELNPIKWEWILKDLKEWVAKLPEEMDDATVIIRELKEDGDKVFNRDTQVGLVNIDQNSKLIIIHDFDSLRIVQKLRKSSEEPKDGE